METIHHIPDLPSKGWVRWELRSRRLKVEHPVRIAVLQHPPYFAVAEPVLQKDEPSPRISKSLIMISHCANPACGVPLLYLRDGRLYQFEVRCKTPNALPGKDERRRTGSRHVSHYWLCGECASLLTLEFDPVSGVVPVAMDRALAAHALA